MLKKFLPIFIYFNLRLLVNCDVICKNEQTLEELNTHLATKTPYRFVENKDITPITYEGCQPTKIWSIIRHGTRNPKRKDIRRMKKELVEIRNNIVANSQAAFCDNEINDFKNWDPAYLEEDKEKYLVEEGERELYSLGERFQKRFPLLLPKDYNELYYKFKFTATERTQKSAENFTAALFGKVVADTIKYPEALQKDPILRFYKLCPRWKKEVDKNPEAQREIKLFSQTELFQNLIKSVSTKLGLELTSGDVYLMYLTCGFETAWNKTIASPWCYIFNNESIKIMEFIEDLEYYWIDGYGYELTYKQACPAAVDLLNFLIPNNDNPKASFYFTHSGTMLKLLAFLGLYKDPKHLTHQDFEYDRKWRVSKIDSFANNLAFILYDCKNGPQVLTMHQERPIQIPGCNPDKDLCDYSLFTKILREKINNCDFHTMCGIVSNNNTNKRNEL